MASRNFTQFRLTLEKRVVDLFAKVSFGASGAPTLLQGKGIVSVTRLSAGQYTFVFGTTAHALDVYNHLNMITHLFDTSGTSAAPASPSMYLVSDSSSIVATCALTIQFNAASTATDPASGEIVHLCFTFGDSTAT